ncbi:hypothetical protein HS088_TW01G00371 [Tripterygium wilfordii]|uniref:Uncharacterized protein n=1 Tax=Tripterygium wilfordii TaxID=458696 RepID=A0A7J7E1Q2_TRIWF|nr:hypothetical protein HS088_TW01G00371 [Tripterygium wilfordii]
MTENFVLFLDHQVIFQLPEINRGGSPIIYDRTKTSRFGILRKRDINESGILWIDVPNVFCFHLYNAWEEDDDTIVVIGSCMNPPDSIFSGSEDPTRTELTKIQLNMRMGESSRKVIVLGMNLETGQVTEPIVRK